MLLDGVEESLTLGDFLSVFLLISAGLSYLSRESAGGIMMTALRVRSMQRALSLSPGCYVRSHLLGNRTP